jgi:cytochrome b pre-mRNA-processing protein 3
MILPWFWRRPDDAKIRAFYGMIVAQARSHAFYTTYEVPDSVDGRFDMIVLHLVLAMRRIGGETPEQQKFNQALFDQLCRDLDGNLREMGIGDLAVPKKMRDFGGAFYGRQTAYLTALAQPDADALVNALGRNIFGTSGDTDRARRLAAYVRAAVRALDAQNDATLLAGTIAFPDPEASSA